VNNWRPTASPVLLANRRVITVAGREPRRTAVPRRGSQGLESAPAPGTGQRGHGRYREGRAPRGVAEAIVKRCDHSISLRSAPRSRKCHGHRGVWPARDFDFRCRPGFPIRQHDATDGPLEQTRPFQLQPYTPSAFEVSEAESTAACGVAGGRREGGPRRSRPGPCGGPERDRLVPLVGSRSTASGAGLELTRAFGVTGDRAASDVRDFLALLRNAASRAGSLWPACRSTSAPTLLWSRERLCGRWTAPAALAPATVPARGSANRPWEGVLSRISRTSRRPLSSLERAFA
jgi:hypothetical protein